MTASRVLLVIAAVLFVAAALVSAGTAIAGISAETFALLGFACWAGSSTV